MLIETDPVIFLIASHVKILSVVRPAELRDDLAHLGVPIPHVRAWTTFLKFYGFAKIDRDLWQRTPGVWADERSRVLEPLCDDLRALHAVLGPYGFNVLRR